MRLFIFVGSLLILALTNAEQVQEEDDGLSFLSEKQKRHLGSTPLEDLPVRVQEIVRQSRAAGDTSHWCCKINPVKTITNTQAVSFIVRTTHSIKGYHHCKAFGWGRCTQYSTGYGQSVKYRVTYKSRQVPTTCPDIHVICCKGYVKVGDKDCIPISKLPELTGDLKILYEQGLIGKTTKNVILVG